MAEAKKTTKQPKKSIRSIISKSAIVKLAKKNGADRIGKDAVVKLVAAAERYIGEITKKAVAAASHANRKSVRGEDVDFVTH